MKDPHQAQSSVFLNAVHSGQQRAWSRFQAVPSPARKEAPWIHSTFLSNNSFWRNLLKLCVCLHMCVCLCCVWFLYVCICVCVHACKPSVECVWKCSWTPQIDPHSILTSPEFSFSFSGLKPDQPGCNKLAKFREMGCKKGIVWKNN